MCRLITIVIYLFLLSGCAFTQANLNINYDETVAQRGPISSVESLNIKISEFEDKRPETDKIGYKKNGFGQKTAHIVSQKPVPEIIREALMAMIEANGHAIVIEGEGIEVSGNVTTFWFDYQTNFWTVEFFGTVGIDMVVSDLETGNVIITRSYDGHHKEESMGGLEGTWERVMNKALEDMMLQINTDRKLIAAIKDY